MPTHPARARTLLKSGRAAVASRLPFAIRLKDRTTSDGTAKVQEVGLGIDPGSRHTGLAVFVSPDPGQTARRGLFAVQVDHRSSLISRRLVTRSVRRRSRRRRLRYRPVRSSNRIRPRGWLAPSLQHRVDGILATVTRLRRLFPITAIHQELVRFDPQRMRDAEISGVEYQQGSLAGFELREYLQAKFRQTCVYCGVRGVPLSLDHVRPRSRGGSNQVSNLVLACVPCNEAKGDRPVEQFVSDPARLAQILAQARRPLRDAAAMNATRWALWRGLKRTGLPVRTGSGGQTKYNRSRNRLEKTHCNDALAVGDIDTIASRPGSVLLAEQTGRGSYSRTRSDRFGFPRLILPRCKVHHGFVTGDTVRAVIPRGKYAGTHVGRVAVRSSGTFALKTPVGLVPAVRYKHCTLIQRNNGWRFVTVTEGAFR